MAQILSQRHYGPPTNYTYSANDTAVAPAADAVTLTQESAVAMTFSNVPTTTADQNLFKAACNKEVGKSYCSKLSGGSNMFQNVDQCYKAEGSTALAGYWSATVGWTGGPTGFEVASAATALNPMRRLTTTDPAVAYVLTATVKVPAAQVATAQTTMTANGAAFAADSTNLGTAIKTAVDSAVANFTLTSAPTPTVTVQAVAGVPGATSSASGLAVSASALVAVVASVVLF